MELWMIIMALWMIIMDDLCMIYDDILGTHELHSGHFIPKEPAGSPGSPWSLVGSGDEELSEAIKELIRRMEEVLTTGSSAGCFRSPKIFQWFSMEMSGYSLKNRPKQ